MRWVLDVIDHNKTFEEDPFYTAQVLGSIPSAFQSTFVESFDLASFNGSDACPEQWRKNIGKKQELETLNSDVLHGSSH